MKTYKTLKTNTAVLDKPQIENYLEKLAASQELQNKSAKNTYPIPRLKENYEIIKQVYELLNDHVKQKITIHPAGEWLLDNFYIIEEVVKTIEKDLNQKKYKNFLGVANGKEAGFARIYVLANEIILYTDNKIDQNTLTDYLKAYQRKKTLSMDEIWNIGIFMQISIIENIREIAIRIYASQMQKYKAEEIIKRIVLNSKMEQKFIKRPKQSKMMKISPMPKYRIPKYSFIEHLAHKLKKEGKRAYAFYNALEEQVEKLGTTVTEVIQKEHFEIAVKKVSMGNSITSLKAIGRINFLEIFENINSVEEILREDPERIYEKMDYKTKEYYRATIKEISNKTKISEIYIAKKALEISKKGQNQKTKHIGYYLIDEGKNMLLAKLGINKKEVNQKQKVKRYISTISIISIIFAITIGYITYQKTNSKVILILSTILAFIPAFDAVTIIIQYILGKIIKPKLIPKLDMSNGINKENSAMVVIPTILKNKEKVEELVKKLEVFYIANKSDNIYFTLLGDVSESSKEEEPFDKEVIKSGTENIQKLNEKYKDETFPKFNFIYRKRIWNEKEGSYLGWERKRGMLTKFNEFLIENMELQEQINTSNNQNQKQNQDYTFQENTIKNWMKDQNKQIPKIKYIITLDADTDLTLNSAFELIGAMAHTLNTPKLNNKKDKVIEGHALIQPRVGIDLKISNKTTFTKIFAGMGGTDLYTNAISDIYQDNFDEGIFTGKGIYDLEIFNQVLKNEIPENIVLSHDLLEGSYLRCALASDIMLMDGYPIKYASFMSRLSRWIRGDWQIIRWLKKKIKDKNGNIKRNPLNLLSKFKILDNLRRSLSETAIILNFILLATLKLKYNIKIYEQILIFSAIYILPYIIEVINTVIFKREGEEKQKSFTPRIIGFKGAFLRAIITLMCLPYKAYISIKSIIKTIYRLIISKKHMLEWMTSEEAEKQAKTDEISYYKNMAVNIIAGIITILISIQENKINIFGIALGILFIIAPYIMCNISKEKNKKKKLEELNKEEQKYILEIAQRTWKFFETYITEENNYLITDNFQEDRNKEIVDRTSSTNIGLSLLAIISAYDLKFIGKEKALRLLKNTIQTIEKLEKWNGHLYNWYDTKTLKPLIPRYVSTVDSGNFVGYLYVVKQFLIEILEKEEKQQESLTNCIQIVENTIQNTDFKVLYSKESKLFSIGYNIEENKLTDSYYDLLASEARQASIVAIAKKDVETKHWNQLSRTLTILGKYKGLISWSGTAFEYLMPTINIPSVEGSLLDESCKFMIMSQQKYAKKLGIPWGISESAFNVKDLNQNYQYKAFGIPWLGLKRGLADERVVSSYGSILAIKDYPKKVLENIKMLEKEGMLSKYGLYESIDYTPNRLGKNQTSAVVKTYMAHHQGLILLSINNLFNNEIFQKRFMQNPELRAIESLLQERMPETAIITKEQKEKVEKLTYQPEENYSVESIKKVNEKIKTSNIIANQNYVIAMDEKGRGFSKYKDILVNRYKKTNDYDQGIFFYIKNIKSKRIWTSHYSNYLSKPDSYEIRYSPDKTKIIRTDGNIKTTTKIIVDTKRPLEIRQINLKNEGQNEEILEITSTLEPVLSDENTDYAHPAFNNLFLKFNYLQEKGIILVKKTPRDDKKPKIYLATNLYTENETMGELEFEIDKEKFEGRTNLNLPQMVRESKPLSKQLGLVTDGIIAMRRTIKIKPQETATLNLLISVSENKNETIKNIEEYQNKAKIKREYELVKAKVEAESRYLGVKAKDYVLYQKMLTYLIFENPLKETYIEKIPKQNYKQDELWKFGISGDLPILLVKIKSENESYIVKKVLKAFEFFRVKNIQIDLVIIDEEKNSYEMLAREEIESIIINSPLSYLRNQKGGIYILNKNELTQDEQNLLTLRANLIIDANKGSLENSIKDQEEELSNKIIEDEETKQIINIEEKEEHYKHKIDSTENLKYYNEYGAFSENGKEYLIKINQNHKLPTVWSHIIANDKFGSVVTENLGGFTWSKNSRLNRITAWSNNPVTDVPSEIIYLKNKQNGKTWTLSSSVMPDKNDYYITYGFGYAKYLHKSEGIIQELQMFVPKEDSLKVNLIKLKNETPKKQSLKLIYYIKPVLEEDEIKSNGYINLEYEETSNTIYFKNLYGGIEKEQIAYITSSEKITSYTGNKNTFIGNGSLQNPEGIKKVSLGKENSVGRNTCIAVQLEVELESFENKEISIILGRENNKVEIKNKGYKYSKTANCKSELTVVQKYWEDILEKVQVYTPLESMNIIINGWAMYQTICSRLLGRTGFYQSGGAFGFRDQLQDTLATKYVDPEIMKNQIIKHSKHQFIEGDVEHWWHEETSRGIRTRFSDDLLWLPYLVSEYIEFTGDFSILDIETPYRKGELLQEGEDEKYDYHPESDIKETIYMHCIRAIEKSLNFGERGLPKIGSGDWNDGFSTVGNQGRGESVWLGFFIYNILDRFIPIIEKKEETQKTPNNEQKLNKANNINENQEETKAEKYKKIMQDLKKALNTVAWDGRWYKRAFTDEGDSLGSIENEECRIDSISQSWSVISNAGDNDKKYISMESLETHLVDKEHQIIKLLDPPFEKGKLKPGYIKSYMPGVRENGGQYSHGAIWTIIANTILGFGEKAIEYFKMINPIEHTRTKEAANKYKIEPYSIAADIYGQGNLAGRGGWTWYTGSSTWYYKAAVENILGLKIKNKTLKIQPCIPKEWKEYQIRYKYENSIYNIKVKNPNYKNTGIQKLTINGQEIEEKEIKLEGSGKIYEIEAEM